MTEPEYDPYKTITRRQFFARMRKLGFKKARMELSRNSITYERTDEVVREDGILLKESIRVTLPKRHLQIIQIMGGEFSGWYIPHGTERLLGSPIPEGWDLLAAVLGFYNGGIIRQRGE